MNSGKRKGNVLHYKLMIAESEFNCVFNYTKRQEINFDDILFVMKV